MNNYVSNEIILDFFPPFLLDYVQLHHVLKPTEMQIRKIFVKSVYLHRNISK